MLPQTLSLDLEL